MSLPDLLWSMSEQKKTGVLKLSRNDLRKLVYIEDGQIVFASSSDPDDRLGELFLREGTITLDQLQDALNQLSRGKRLGTLLVEAGSLSPGDLVQGVLRQVESIVLDVFGWEEGEYLFDEGPLPTDEVITLGMKTGEILLRGIRRIRSFHRMRRSVGPAHQWYGLTPDCDEALDGIALPEGEQLLLERLRDGDERVERLCREVFLSNFEIYQTLWGLKVLGAIQERENSVRASSEVSLEGSLQQTGFDELLVQLGRGHESGVLYVSRQELERTFHIREGRCVFATSGDPEDGLVAYLLRRGVISLRDREETEKRLLSNKRVGTILRELGVIDDRDLREMVRQQISEIVYDTFRWDDAHFAFISGPLPSNEQITLEESLDRLVAEGIRRVTSWRQVRRGCGGLDSPLALHPSYMDVLDAMGAGPEEWHVLAALKSVRTPHDICRESVLGDFRVCQILWALRVLGAVEIRPRAELGDDPPVLAEPATEAAVRDIAVIGLDNPAEAEEPVEEPVLVESVESIEVEESAPAEEYVEVEQSIEAEEYVEIEQSIEAEEPVEVEESIEAEEPVEQAEMPVELSDSEPEEPRIIPVEVIESFDEPISAADDSPAAFVADAESDEPEIETEPAPVADESDPIREPWAESPPDATQIIPRDVVQASLAAGSGERDEIGGEEDDGSGEFVADLDRQVGDPPSAESTQVIPREAIDQVLSAAPSDAGPEAMAQAELDEPQEPGFEPPLELEGLIAKFNAIQRLVYRAIRSEVGAGAANFILACRGQLLPDASESLLGAELQADGSWDAETLRRAVVQKRIDDPWPDYQSLISIEIELLRNHISDTRVMELEQQLARVEASDPQGV